MIARPTRQYDCFSPLLPNNRRICPWFLLPREFLSFQHRFPSRMTAHFSKARWSCLFFIYGVQCFPKPISLAIFQRSSAMFHAQSSRPRIPTRTRGGIACLRRRRLSAVKNATASCVSRLPVPLHAAHRHFEVLILAVGPQDRVDKLLDRLRANG